MVVNLPIVDQAEKGGIVPRGSNLWDGVELVNFGALISEIDVIRASSGVFTLVLTFKVSFKAKMMILLPNCV